ncbi:DHH family phosphoesterase [Actinophytocola xanthii]|uniref:Phosphoesterase n=1 Tax=Actinophytocola xanthii TaxID=1912961 RepID=A0A1Q8BTP1_9PSEU|nr:DHH family phosphoesterase [Actinophytocola xanthii]OLF05422.1 phosphoesterase [Actinophytocola xanthii]
MPGTDLGDATALLRTATDVTLLAHVTPDADALGSALALGLALHRRGARVRVSFGSPEETPESLRWLDVAGLVVPALEVPPSAALLVACDVASLDRLGQLADRVEATVAAGGAVLVVDHHASNTRFGTHHVVDETAEATTVLAALLLEELGVPLDADLAHCLYAGLVTDTSSFRRARPATHELAARLLAAGADPERTARQLFGSHPFAFLRMLAAVLGRAVLEPEAVGGRGLVHTAVLLTDQAGVRVEEVESVVDVLRTTAEAEVAAVLKQKGPGTWTGSLRAEGAVDVRAAALRFGGGGHRLAAGFTAHGELDEVVDRLREALRVPVLLASG